MLAILIALQFAAPIHSTPDAISSEVASQENSSPIQSVSPALSIVENRGQFSTGTAFALHAKDRVVQFTESGLQIALRGGESFELQFGQQGQPLQWSGLQASGTKVNYCSGPAENWVLNAPGWFSVTTELRAGVAVQVEFRDHRLKYSFHLDAGIKPDDLLIRFPGADSTSILEDGSLVIQKGESQIEDLAPKAWQNAVDGEQHVDVNFVPYKDSKIAVELTVGDYDQNLPLIVDPEMLLLCGLIGGSLNEEGRGIGIDQAGNLFVTGFSESDDMPVVNAYQGTYAGGSMDVWVAKIAPDHSISFLTYLGGSSKELPYDLSVGPNGNAYVVGGTQSADFPYLNGPDSVHHGVLDCFVTKLSTDGIPIYSGTFGGSGFDSLRGNYVDSNGIHYVIGRSFTDDGSFPINGGPLTSHSGGGSDVIMAKISADGSTLLFSGFLGGDKIDYGRDITTDSAGNVYACGWTNSDESTFPTLIGPDLTHNGGAQDYGTGWPQYGDAWVAKLTPDGTQFLYVGFIGGANGDAGFGLAVDEQNRLIVAGHTTSDETTFPVAVGPGLVYKGNKDVNAFGDMWVGRVKADGTGLEYCGYVGGNAHDRAWRMARSPIDGAIYLAGSTASHPNTVPHMAAGARSLVINAGDGLLVRVEPEGRWVDYSTTFPGEAEETIRDVVIGADNSVHVVGWSKSSLEFPVVTPGWTHQGLKDAFVASLPPFHQLIRAGNLWPNFVTKVRPAVLKVDGSAGADYLHEVSALAGNPLSISVDSPQNTNEPFAVYMIPREAIDVDAFHIEYLGTEYGTSTFALPALFSTDPGFETLVNGFGFSILGIPVIPGAFQAPSSFSWTPPSAGTYTLQGVIFDHLKQHKYSLTNAVVVRVH